LGEHLDSLISGTRRLKEKEEYIFRSPPPGCEGSEAGPTWRRGNIQDWLASEK
jgi:hypothetical protein